MKCIPLKLHFYTKKQNKKKMVFARVYIFFLVLFQNIDCGYSLEQPRKAVLMSMFCAKVRKISKILKIFILLQLCYFPVSRFINE